MTCVHGRPVADVCADCTGNLALARIPALPAIFPGMRWAPPPAIASNVGGCVLDSSRFLS